MSEVTLFAAADVEYFYNHGFAFAKSAVDVGNFVHIIIWKDGVDQTRGEEQTKFLKFMTNFHEHIARDKCRVQLLSHNTVTEFRKNLKILENRAFCACVRFLLLESVVKAEYEMNDRAVMVLDMDSIVRKKIEIPHEYDMGVFLRENEEVAGTEYEKQGMKVAAGALYVTVRSLDFINGVRHYIANNPIKWFADQHAIYKAYNEYKALYNILEIKMDLLDWEFSEDSMVWTGKGQRKFENEKYLTAKKENEIGLL